MTKIEEFIWLDERHTINPNNVAWFQIAQDGRLVVAFGSSESSITIEKEDAAEVIEALKRRITMRLAAPKQEPPKPSPMREPSGGGGPQSWMAKER